MPSFDSLFELLFKYPARTFASGTLRFAPSWIFLAVAAVLLLAVLPGLWRYWRQSAQSRRSGGARLLVAARVLLLLLIVFCLARPMLFLRTVAPQQSFVGVLVDDSRSMTIGDAPDVARGAATLDLLGADGGDLLGVLGQRFKVRLFSFSDDLRRVSSPAELRFQGDSSRLGAALIRGADELDAVPLAGLVVLTDGADNSGEALESSILELKSRGVPVYPIGLGRERFDRDVQVSRVEAPPRVLRGSTLQVEVTLEQTGYAGEVVDLEVMDDGRIVSSEKVKFPATGEAVVTRVSFKADAAGARQFQFRTAPQRDEAVAENNQRRALIQVDDRVEKILYFEGEPRFELKFMRRAVAADKNLQLVDPAAHRGEPILSIRARRARRARRRLPDQARGSVPLRRPHPRLDRGELLHARPAPAHRGVRLRARRRVHDARRPPLVQRGRLERHAGGGAPAGHAVAGLERRLRRGRAVLRRDRRRADRLGQEPSRAATRRRPRRPRSRSGSGCRGSRPSTRSRSSSRAPPTSWSARAKACPASRWCSPTSATGAASHWPGACMTPGTGRCTPTCRSRTRPTRPSGASSCAGW